MDIEPAERPLHIRLAVALGACDEGVEFLESHRDAAAAWAACADVYQLTWAIDRLGLPTRPAVRALLRLTDALVPAEHAGALETLARPLREWLDNPSAEPPPYGDVIKLRESAEITSVLLVWGLGQALGYTLSCLLYVPAGDADYLVDACYWLSRGVIWKLGLDDKLLDEFVNPGLLALLRDSYRAHDIKAAVATAAKVAFWPAKSAGPVAHTTGVDTHEWGGF